MPDISARKIFKHSIKISGIEANNTLRDFAVCLPYLEAEVIRLADYDGLHVFLCIYIYINEKREIPRQTNVACG